VVLLFGERPKSFLSVMDRKPLMAVSGVRSSCDTMLMKSDLISSTSRSLVVLRMMAMPEVTRPVVEDWRVADFGPDAAAGAVLDELLALGDGDAFARTRSMGRDVSGAGAVGADVVEDFGERLADGFGGVVLVIWVQAGLKPTMVPERSKMTIPSSVNRKTASQRSRRALTSW
jgi:hypothetical protein